MLEQIIVCQQNVTIQINWSDHEIPTTVKGKRYTSFFLLLLFQYQPKMDTVEQKNWFGHQAQKMLDK